MGIGNFGMWEMLVIGLIVLIFFGPRRLPEIARSAGKAMREFKRGMNEIQRELEIAELEQKKSAQRPAAEAPTATPAASPGPAATAPDTTTPSIQPPIPTFAGAAAAATTVESTPSGETDAREAEAGLYDGTEVDVGGEPQSVERRVESAVMGAEGPRASTAGDDPDAEVEGETEDRDAAEAESPRPDKEGSG